MRRAAKIDGNQNATVDYLRRLGWGVYITSAVGGDFPDLVVAREGFTALVELKKGRWLSERKLSEGQRQFRETWPGACILALSPEDAAVQLLAILRGWKP